MLENFKVLSNQFWMSAFSMVLVDVAFILLLTWRLKSSQFRELKWTLVGTSAFFWSTFAIVLVLLFWNTYYQFFFPGWFRSGGILLYVPLLYGVFALFFQWLALRIPGNPIFNF
jgi:hypothetical protein